MQVIIRHSNQEAERGRRPGDLIAADVIEPVEPGQRQRYGDLPNGVDGGIRPRAPIARYPFNLCRKRRAFWYLGCVCEGAYRAFAQRNTPPPRAAAVRTDGQSAQAIGGAAIFPVATRGSQVIAPQPIGRPSIGRPSIKRPSIGRPRIERPSIKRPRIKRPRVGVGRRQKRSKVERTPRPSTYEQHEQH